MHFVFKATVLLAFVFGTQAAWPLSYFPEVVKKIYADYFTCARELNRQVFNAISGADNIVSKEEAKALYDAAVPDGSDEDFEDDFKKAASFSIGQDKITMLGMQAYMRNHAMKNISSSFDDMIGSALHGIIDMNNNGVVEEEEILGYTSELGEMAARPITAKHYVGCMTHLIPEHMEPFFHKVYNQKILPSYDKGALLSPLDVKGDGLLGPKEMKRMFVGSASRLRAALQGVTLTLEDLKGQFDINGDGQLDESEFVQVMLEHVENLAEPDIGITFLGFLKVYDTNNNLLVDAKEAGRFLQEAEEEGSEELEGNEVD